MKFPKARSPSDQRCRAPTRKEQPSRPLPLPSLSKTPTIMVGVFEFLAGFFNLYKCYW